MHGDVDQPSVTVREVGEDGVVIAAVHGDFDVDTFRDVREALFTCLNGRAAALGVDLGDVGFFGSMGIAVLVEVRQRADVVGAGFAVVAGRRSVARPIRMTDTEDLRQAMIHFEALFDGMPRSAIPAMAAVMASRRRASAAAGAH